MRCFAPGVYPELVEGVAQNDMEVTGNQIVIQQCFVRKHDIIEINYSKGESK
jgi:hypothetical protein